MSSSGVHLSEISDEMLNEAVAADDESALVTIPVQDGEQQQVRSFAGYYYVSTIEMLYVYIGSR